MNSAHEALSGWWERPDFARFLADLMRAELARLRPDLNLHPAAWTEATSFLDGALKLDSLDRLRLASAVATALNVTSAPIPDRLREAGTFGEWLSDARRIAAQAGAVAFKSSGSGGAPVSVVHQTADLGQEIAVLADLFATRRRVVASVSAHHIYGFLFTVLLPHVLGCEVLDARRASPAALGAVLRAGDLLVAFPTVWEAAAEGGVRWPDDVIGVSSGAHCRSGLARELAQAGLREWVEIYGSTETGGIGWRTLGDAPFRLFGFWSRLDDDHLVKGAGTYLLPDVVTWTDPAHLVPSARRDRAVQVGGVNVYPSRARAVLMAHAGVADAAVRLMRMEEGERLKAFIVPREPAVDRHRLQESLIDWVEARLAAAERPRSFTFGASVPIAASGKPADW
jgi:4-coumarate--CoA ligase (photoactive yellow protein activation family)